MVEVTIIVPVYNASLTLKRCIDSILNQTFVDFELILVNDGSKDNSLDICCSYARVDSRIKCYSQENAGVSSARNKGLEEATGKYICFIDADDEVDACYLSDLVSKIHKGSSFLVLQGLRRIKESAILYERFPDSIIDGSKFDLLFSKYDISRYGYPVSKLYIRNIIEQHHIRFYKDVTFSEDLLFMLDYLSCVDEVIISHEANYLYYETEGSLTKRIFNYEVESRALDAFLVSLNNLAHSKEIDAEKLLVASGFSLSVFTERILLSIYYGVKSDYSYRLDALRRFYNEYGNCFAYCSGHSLLYHIVYCLSSQHYRCADALMNGYMLAKKIKNLLIHK